jgi:two-component system phosphate regulon response regulator PhoB
VKRTAPAHGTLILVVEDEADLRRLLVEQLAAAGYRAVAAEGGVSALERARAHRPAMVLLDLSLPDLAGEDVCRTLKGDAATAHAAVVMLTGKVAEADRIAGFEQGADDYITKPFSLRELIVRLDTVRRSLREAVVAPSATPCGRIEVDQGGLGARVDGRWVALTATEGQLLKVLIEAAGRVCTREELFHMAWEAPVDPRARKLRTYVRRLRQKLGTAGTSIETVRSVGYRLRVHRGI